MGTFSRVSVGFNGVASLNSKKGNKKKKKCQPFITLDCTVDIESHIAFLSAYKKPKSNCP